MAGQVIASCRCSGGCTHDPKLPHRVCLTCAVLRLRPVVFAMIAACAHAIVVASPASMPGSQPVEPLPAGLFRPLEQDKPNGDQVITRKNLESLAAHVVHERAQSAAAIADMGARVKAADGQRDAAVAAAAHDKWKATWMPVLTAVGGASFAVAAVVIVELAAGLVKH